MIEKFSRTEKIYNSRMIDGMTESSTFSILKSFSSEFATDGAQGMKARLPNSVWAPGKETVKTSPWTM